MRIGKHKFLKISAVVLALVVIGIAIRIYVAGSLFPECDKGVLESQLSPDGRWVAEKVLGVCDGATGVVFLDVNLHRAGEDATTILDMDLVDGDKVTIKWRDSNHLVISYPIIE